MKLEKEPRAAKDVLLPMSVAAILAIAWFFCSTEKSDEEPLACEAQLIDNPDKICREFDNSEAGDVSVRNLYISQDQQGVLFLSEKGGDREVRVKIVRDIFVPNFRVEISQESFFQRIFQEKADEDDIFPLVDGQGLKIVFPGFENQEMIVCEDGSYGIIEVSKTTPTLTPSLIPTSYPKHSANVLTITSTPTPIFLPEIRSVFRCDESFSEIKDPVCVNIAIDGPSEIGYRGLIKAEGDGELYEFSECRENGNADRWIVSCAFPQIYFFDDGDGTIRKLIISLVQDENKIAEGIVGYPVAPTETPNTEK